MVSVARRCMSHMCTRVRQLSDNVLVTRLKRDNFPQTLKTSQHGKMADSTADSITDKTNLQVDTDDEIFYPTVKEKRPGSLILQRQSNVVRDSVSSDEGESNHFGVFQFDGAYVTDFQYGERLARAKHERQHSIVDGLLCEIYDRWQGNQRDSFDSDTFTECSSTSEIFGHTRGDWERRHARQLHRAFLETKGIISRHKLWETADLYLHFVRYKVFVMLAWLAISDDRSSYFVFIR